MIRIDDHAAFAQAVERHRRELQLHCYRMLGSLVESEDLVQETFLRAWRRRETFEGRSSVRAWLYKIATNACLDALAKRPRRFLPADVVPATTGDGPPSLPEGEVPWLEPFPDALLDEADPAAVVVARETIELAFLAAIQHLPPRQRAVLILRDVLGWPASETAELLDMSVAAVKSALQRARATLKQHLSPDRAEWAPAAEPTAEERAALQRYMDAHQRGDRDALAAVLREDVRVSYAPMGLWAEGSEPFIEASREHALPGEVRFVATRANRQPATAIYLRGPGEAEFRLVALEVLRVQDGRIAEIVDFSEPRVLAAFGLPQTL